MHFANNNNELGDRSLPEPIRASTQPGPSTSVSPWLLALAVIAFCVAAHGVLADSRRVIDYDYDDSGNLTRIDSETNDSPPTITNIIPDSMRIGPPVSRAVTGTNLRGASVTTDHAELIVTDVQTDSTSATFTLQASANVPLGTHDITFTTGLGSANVAITVKPRLPIITLGPAPIALPSNGAPTPLTLQLQPIDIDDHVINVSVADTGVATANIASTTVTAGTAHPVAALVLTGVTTGTTTLTLSSPTLNEVSYTIFVADQFVPPPGPYTADAQPLGIDKEFTPPEVLTDVTPVVADLSVEKEFTPAAVDIEIAPVVASTIGIAKSGAVTGISPQGVVLGASAEVLTISGSGLGAIDAVTVVPSDDITVGALTVDPGGQTVSVPITVAADADIGPRQIVLSAGGVPVSAVDDSDRIFISAALPVMVAIDPNVVRRTEITTLIVRGEHLHGASAVSVSPNQGVTVGDTITVSADGTEVQVDLAIDVLATLGDRIVQVTTPVGITTATLSELNRLTIVNGIAGIATPIVAANVGVVKGSGGINPSPEGDLIAKPLGIAKGASIFGLNPSSATIGSNPTLTIQGHDLLSVTSVDILPSDGITVGAPIIDPSGDFITLDLTIAPDAPETERRVEVLSSGTPIKASSPTADRFRVTPLLPVVNSVVPNVVVIGAGPSDITVNGAFLDGASSVSVLPGDHLSVSPPIVAPDGNSLTVTVAAGAGATTGPRVLVVETTAGQSATTASPANTITVASGIASNIDPIVAPLVGIEKQIDGGAASVTSLVVANPVGIEKSFTPPPGTVDVPLASSALGVAFGTSAVSVSPSALPTDTVATLVVSGNELDPVTGATIVPNDDITITGAVTVSPDGQQVSVPVTVGPLAAETLRQVVLTTATGTVSFSASDGDRVRIVGDEPVINSIAPIQELRGASFSLTINGFNLDGASVVEGLPGTGLNFGSVTVNGTGTQLTVQMTVDVDAPLIAHVVRVTTPAGVSTSTALPANTFTVVSTP